MMRALRYLWALPTTSVGLLFVPFVLLARGRGRVVDGVLELHGPLAAALLRRCIPIGGGAIAMTFGHVVVGRDAACLDASRSHERVHVRQCEVWGPAFIPAYLLASLWALAAGRNAYAGNYFERDAFCRESSDEVRTNSTAGAALRDTIRRLCCYRSSP